MNIVVLNGSPKGSMSVTMQYLAYIQKHFKEHHFDIINVSQKIREIEKNKDYLRHICEKVKNSDGIIWAFPVYMLLVPSQYKRFIELLFEKGFNGVFTDKYCAALSSSIHFYDHTAHNYIHAVCDDLRAKYFGFFSADMHDLFKRSNRNKLLDFAQHFFKCITNKIALPKHYNPVVQNATLYKNTEVINKLNCGKKNILVLKDSNKNININNMVQKFKECFSDTDIEIFHLDEIITAGGCCGCLRCGFDNICTYHSKDIFSEFYKSKVKKADAIIIAGSIKDRFLSSKWKQFFDRSFFNTHIPTLMNKQVGYIISGPLRQISNMRETLEGYVECLKGNVVGFVTDEYDNSNEIDIILQDFAKHIEEYLKTNYSLRLVAL